MKGTRLPAAWVALAAAGLLFSTLASAEPVGPGADSESAVPGYSQHQLGTAIDFGSITDAFDATPESRWLADHAWRYGFSLSYPKGYEWLTGYRYEGGRYRYIGRAAAEMQRAFFADIQQYLLLFLHQYRVAFLKSRVR